MGPGVLIMIPRAKFDATEPRHSGRWQRYTVLGAAALLLALVPGSRPVTPVPGKSGDVYLVYGAGEVWRAVGPVLSVHFRTTHGNRSSVAAEASDILPYFAARADSADLKYVLIRANRPIFRIGSRLGLYRAWNFRYERAEEGWVASGYW